MRVSVLCHGCHACVCVTGFMIQGVIMIIIIIIVIRFSWIPNDHYIDWYRHHHYHSHQVYMASQCRMLCR